MNTYQNWKLNIDDNNIACLHFDKADTSTNVLSGAVLNEFSAILDTFAKDTPQGIIILSDKVSGFIAGADISEFTPINSKQEAFKLIQRGQQIFDQLEALPCPSVCLIDGFCVGGGLELALACDYRIASDSAKTRLGLPEVKLGIHPGFGGSMRLNRLIGAVDAMGLMLTGRTVDARQAKRLGIVDYSVAQRHLLRAGFSIVSDQPAVHRPSKLKTLASNSLVRPLLAKYLRKQVAQRARKEHYPAPYALIEVWEKHAGDERKMLDAELNSVAELIIGETAQNLVRVFFLQDRLKALGKQTDKASVSQSANLAQHIHVIGAGVMGGDIAAWSAVRGCEVSLQDMKASLISPAIKRAAQLFRKRYKPSYLRNQASDRLRADVDGTGVKQADVIIEAIVENAEIKQSVFKQLETQAKPDAILATNTSSIPLETLNQALQQPERLVGIHFFNPVAKMQLVEIVTADNTSQQVAARAAGFVRSLDRLPLPVKSSPGFLINRILMPYLLEAMELLSEGVAAEHIDESATQFGMPMGPIALADTVGLDICHSVANILAEQLSMSVPAVLNDKIARQQFGKKSGQGFYRYAKGKAVLQTVKSNKQMDDGENDAISERLILRLLNECVACLREQVVADTDLLDAGMIFATGFAPFRGGPMHYLKQRDPATVQQRLLQLAEQHGERFKPDSGWDDVIRAQFEPQ